MTGKPNPVLNIPVPDPGPNPGPNPDGEISENQDGQSSNDQISTADLAPDEEVTTLGGGFVAEDRQQAVIGWNGEEEVLILTTNEKLLTSRGTAVLHFMPLPGKVKDIYRADKEVFNKAKKLVTRKLQLDGVSGLGLFMERTIGTHNIWVWKIDDPKEFPRRVQQYVLKRFGDNARAYITKKMLDVIAGYHQRGFRYFAFDLVLMDTRNTTKEAIAYHFECPQRAYYPLVISSGGGKGETLVDMVLFTKGELTRMKKLVGGTMRRLGDRSVPVSHEELRELDPRMAGLFSPGSALTGRILQIAGKLESFATDFEARP